MSRFVFRKQGGSSYGRHERQLSAAFQLVTIYWENPLPVKAFILTIVPRWADIDFNQHMRHSAFADWAAYVRTEWLSVNNLDIRKLLDLKIAPIMFEERATYFKEILLGERITIELQLAGSNHDASRWLLRHTFRRGAAVCAVSDAKGAWFDVATRRIAQPPPGLLEAYANMVRTDDYMDLGVKENVA
jgi:acyl-CoA thioester hydrolase